MTDAIAPLTDKEVNQRVTDVLLFYPERIGEFETFIADLSVQVWEKRRLLVAAELDAQINAVATGGDMKVRELERKQAVQKDATCQALQAEITNLENMLAAQEATLKGYSKKFQGAIALAELQAARLLSTYCLNKAKEQNGH